VARPVLLAVWVAFGLAAFNARADVISFTLDNVILADGQQITGTFDWTFNVGDFEGGSGAFTALEIPYTAYSFAAGNLNIVIETNSIEISGNGNFHDMGLDIKLKLPAQPFSPTQSAPLDLGLSFFECCGNGFKDQPFVSGSVSPTDSDGDGVADFADNCPAIPNPLQTVNDQGATQMAKPDGVACACLCGDVNGDCVINSSDALEIMLFSGFAPPATSFDVDYCDVNRDGACDSSDALELARWSGFAPPQTLINFGEPYLCQ